MTSLEHLTLEVADPSAAEDFYTALGLTDYVRVRESQAATTGFRGFTLSLVMGQPATVNGFVDAAVDAGATVVKPAEKSLWGYGGALRTPDGTIVTLASASKKDTGPDTGKIDTVVLQLGAADVGASKRFYLDRGFRVAKSFGSYVELDTAPIKLSLYKRNALAKTVGIAPDGTGSHRLQIRGDAGSFDDPDGFTWYPVIS